MDYLDNLDLPELLDFIDWRNSYKKTIMSYDKLVADAEAKYEYEKEERQLKYFENKKN